MTIEDVSQIRRTAQLPVSLEKPVGDEEESEFGHFLTDESEPLPDEAAETTLRRETLLKILGTLSEREREALALAATSGTVADIAATLGLSEGTVRNHLSAAIQKVGARNRAEAARIAADKGWLAPETEG